MHISSSYAKILGETNFHTREIPRSGSKAKDRERKRKRKEERLNEGDNNGQATYGARKHAWRTQAAWAKRIFHLLHSAINKPDIHIEYIKDVTVPQDKVKGIKSVT